MGVLPFVLYRKMPQPESVVTRVCGALSFKFSTIAIAPPSCLLSVTVSMYILGQSVAGNYKSNILSVCSVLPVHKRN